MTSLTLMNNEYASVVEAVPLFLWTPLYITLMLNPTLIGGHGLQRNASTKPV